MPELARSRADGVIDRSKTRGIPLDPSAAEGRSSVWNLCRGNHLGQRSCASATTGRTYGRKRSDQSTAQHPCEERAVHIWIKEGKGAIKWTRLSCRSFAANAARLQLHALAYNLGNFLRTLATPESIKDWSLTTLKEKLIKIGAKIVSHGRYVAFQMAEVAIPKNLFADILRMISELRSPPVPSTA
jgi:Transposase DDE domain group 1